MPFRPENCDRTWTARDTINVVIPAAYRTTIKFNRYGNPYTEISKLSAEFDEWLTENIQHPCQYVLGNLARYGDGKSIHLVIDFSNSDDELLFVLSPFCETHYIID